MTYRVEKFGKLKTATIAKLIKVLANSVCGGAILMRILNRLKQLGSRNEQKVLLNNSIS